MKGLFLKDVYVLWKNSKFSIIIASFFLILSIVSGITNESSSIILDVFPFIFVGVLPINLLSYDESYRWESYAAAMPYTKSQLVSVKYILAFILNLSIFCLQMIATALKVFILKSSLEGEFALNIGMFLSFGILLPSFLLPIIFKFGVQKSRLIYIIFYIAVYSLFLFVKEVDVASRLSRITLRIPVMVALICAAVFVLYALSWALSVKFYRRREF